MLSLSRSKGPFQLQHSPLESLFTYIVHKFSMTHLLKKEKVFKNGTGRRQVIQTAFSKVKSVFGTLAGAGVLSDRHVQGRKA